MAWTEPAYSKTEVNAAGKVLASGEAIEVQDWVGFNQALEVLNNWRSSHSFPLNTFQVTLRNKSRALYPSALVAQRIKRVPSVIYKLRRFPSISLSQMQDIGGCRAVVDTAAHVAGLRDSYLKSGVKHELVRQKNYIQAPKESGYRGIHLIYRYHSDRGETYNGLQIEMQLRSRVQHAWATAVETVGTFLEQSLKSSQGSAEWLRFFAVVSSAFARMEGTPIVPGTLTNKRELTRFIAREARALQVESKLRAYGAALEVAQESAHESSHFFLLELRPEQNTLTVRGYALNELTRATTEYLEVEKELADVTAGQAVLVSASSLEALRRAYPNYYLDTEVFMTYLKQIIG